ncbi:phosphatidylethanolamine-binding protein 4 [Mantella aurantiaca]
MMGYLTPVWCLLALIPVFSCGSCVPKPIVGEDAVFCSPDLQVIYPEIGNVACLHIPACNGYIQKLVHSWGAPQIIYKKAKVGTLYVVIIADPDAPSRSNPKRKYWRHFLAINVPGEDLQNGEILSGSILTAYTAPSPPKGTGYHRYQISVYIQQPGTKPNLLPEEKSLGNWDPKAFAVRNKLDGPVATTQFMVQNPEDEIQEI